jgi:hypothetical protein
VKSLDEVAGEVIALLEREGIPYAIMGGFAVRLYGLPRPTFDVDFTVAIDRDSLPPFYQAAEQLGLTVPAAQSIGWVDDVRGLPVIKLQWYVGDRAIDVDLFLAETAFQQELMRRRVQNRAEGVDGWFVTAEDLILLKLLAGRPKDLVDIGDILLVHGRLDEDYLRQWAKHLGITAELETALQA